MSTRGREFVEAALCIAAYLAYMEFCTLKGTEETRLFKGFTQRSAGPLWALLKACLAAMGSRAEVCREFRELITPEFSAAVDSAVNNIDQVKHGKAALAEGDLLRPVTILANVGAKVFTRVAFGLFEQVQKRVFSQTYEGIFRRACGTPPFVDTAHYEGASCFFATTTFAVITEKGVAVPLIPLVFWDVCEKHPDLEGGHCFLFDIADRDGGVQLQSCRLLLPKVRVRR